MFLRSLLIFLLLASSACYFKESKINQKLDYFLQEGNRAFNEKQYDKALHLFNEGLKIVPNEPTFLSNKSTVIRIRAVEKFNNSLKLTDQTLRNSNSTEAKKDLQDSVEMANAVINQLRNQLEIPFWGEGIESLRRNTFFSRAESLRILASIGEKSKADEALSAINEYLEIEPDTAKKIKMQLSAGRMLIDTFNGDLAAVEYKKILAFDENNIEALLGVGLALAQSNDKNKAKESKKYLQQFINLASETHPQFSIAKEILNSSET